MIELEFDIPQKGGHGLLSRIFVEGHAVGVVFTEDDEFCQAHNIQLGQTIYKWKIEPHGDHLKLIPYRKGGKKKKRPKPAEPKGIISPIPLLAN